MPVEVYLPAEIRLRILEYLDEEGLTLWQKSDTLRKTRLVNHAWCQSTNELLFDHITITAERCLDFEIEHILKLDALSKTPLANFVKTLSVYLSPNYYKYILPTNGERGPPVDILQYLEKYIPECVPRLQRLEVFELCLPRGEYWADIDPVNWELHTECRQRYYNTLHQALSGSVLPRLTALSIDLFEICDMKTFMYPYNRRIYRNRNENGATSQPNEERYDILLQNLAQIRHFSISIKTFPRPLLCDRNCNVYHRFNGSSRYVANPMPLRALFGTGLPSLESLAIDHEAHNFQFEYHLDMRNYFAEERNRETRYWEKRSMRSVDMALALLSYEDIIYILDTSRDTLEEVVLTWCVDETDVEDERIMMEKLDVMREKLASMPRLREARIRSPVGHIEIPEGKLSFCERKSWLDRGKYYFPDLSLWRKVGV